MPAIITSPSPELFEATLRDPYDEGWHFGSGNPEYWQYADQLVVPGGSVLDVGMGYGRSSFFFATHGMSVTGYDLNPSSVEAVNDMVAAMQTALPLDIKANVGDVTTVDLPADNYDLAILDASLTHQPDKTAAYNVLESAFTSVKPGGHLWVRAVGKLFTEYAMQREMAAYDSSIEIVDNDTIKLPCSCSGEWAVEPTVYFDQTELLTYFARNGARIILHQVLPEQDCMNIMYGEDFNGGSYVGQSGMITLIAQK